jgi:GTP:adenosylcobinamide-phosphate guanylyltransferase
MFYLKKKKQSNILCFASSIKLLMEMLSCKRYIAKFIYIKIVNGSKENYMRDLEDCLQEVALMSLAACS